MLVGTVLQASWETRLTATLSSLAHHILAGTCCRNAITGHVNSLNSIPGKCRDGWLF